MKTFLYRPFQYPPFPLPVVSSAIVATPIIACAFFLSPWSVLAWLPWLGLCVRAWRLYLERRATALEAHLDVNKMLGAHADWNELMRDVAELRAPATIKFTEGAVAEADGIRPDITAPLIIAFVDGATVPPGAYDMSDVTFAPHRYDDTGGPINIKLGARFFDPFAKSERK